MKTRGRSLLFLLVLAALPFASIRAQITSTLGWFEINYNQGCSPLQVSVKTAVSENDVPIFQFNGMDDPNPVAWRDTYDSLSHTYSTPGTYMVYLTVQTNNTTRQDSLSVNVLQTQIPVFELRNCEANGIEVDIQDNFYDSFVIDYGDGSIESVNRGAPNPVHSYADSQTYTVQVTGRLNNAPNNCGSLSELFTPTPSLTPAFVSLLEVTDLNDILLSFNLPQNVVYRLEASSNSATNFQFLRFLDPVDTALTLNGFLPDAQRYCFRIGASDACTGNLIYSNSICTITSSLNIINNVNQLSWSTLEQGLNEESYQVSRNAIPDFTTLPAGTFTFNDQLVTCNTEYCYTVTTQYANSSQSIAPSVCGTAFSTDRPPNVENLSVDLGEGGVLLTWDDLAEIDTSFIVQTNTASVVLNRYEVTTNPAFFIIDNDETIQTCYEHSYRDVCGNFSSGFTPVCSILLTGIGNADGSITLNWNDYTGWSEGVRNYTLEKYDPTGSLLESIDLELSTNYVDEIDGSTDQIVKYIVRASPQGDGIPDIRSNEIDIARRAQLHYPTAFTPDGDGLNDIFKPEYLFIKEYELGVYNRWGELIFSSSDIDVGWDGLINGEPALEGNYTYLTKAEDFRGLKISRSGIVLLLRNN